MKKESFLQYIKRLFKEAFVEPFKKDDRWRTNFTGRVAFMNQVGQLKKEAVKNV